MFRPAVIHTKSASIGTGLKVRLQRAKTSPAKLVFVASTAVVSQYGWSVGDKLEVMIGEQDHHGLIRVRKNNSIGIATLSKKGGDGKEYFTFSLGHQPLYVDRAETSRWCGFVGVDSWVEITLPAWAKETAPAAVRKAVEPPSAAPRGPQARARAFGDVTANLMGDPAPGRSALATREG
ncbi:hypothetical protein HFO65_15775 [Rhizobium laguerreae]|uniref:hypothetical protein n=1 Tax=Rhizobium laguerreae TaxID=1076926 RepID=UPI001C925A58|nr:hypothetical protein [Rhizobium laguerreae]MBY3162093.1 hypothetical protein [Rhizobium laguerreae]